MRYNDIRVKDFMDIVYYQTKFTLKDYYSGEIFEDNVTPITWNEHCYIYNDYYVYAVGEGPNGLEVKIGK